MLRRLLIGSLVLISAAATAQTRHRVVVDLFSGGRLSFESTLGNVANLKRAFGEEPLEVEIVCYGPGIDLVLSHDNPLARQVKKLHDDGVAFAACRNTLLKRKIATQRIFPFVRVVDAGIAEVVRKEEAGWSYVRR